MFTPSAQLVADMRRWEGSSLVVYPDSRGNATQGIGRHSGVNFGDPAIDAATEIDWLMQDLRTAYFGAQSLFPKIDAMDQVRREAVIALTFNMGLGTLAQFAPFICYVRLGKWSEAAFHLLTNMSGHLTPYLNETGARAAETALRIATGEVLDEFVA